MILYHVTFTKSIQSIRMAGIKPMCMPNWRKGKVDGEHYSGKGEIFAFDIIYDAYRWATRMEWEFFESTGSGKISIVTFRERSRYWKIDDADPLSRAGCFGKWWKKFGSVDPRRIIAINAFHIDNAREVIALDRKRLPVV